MARETKSNGQKDIYDRFYTPIETVSLCLELLDLNDYDCIIEPSAGIGNFSDKIENCFAYDIMPEKESIKKQDWFALDKQQFLKYNNILVVGNPPFGEQNKLAINFFNEAAKFCNCIAFILPLSFKKYSVQNQLDFNFHLTKELILLNNTFYLLNKEEIKVPCVFQVWEKKDFLRDKIILKTNTELFDFTSKEQADFRVQRVGGNAGKAFENLEAASSSNYFIKNKSKLSNQELISLINSLTFPTIEYTVGPKSLPKGELIQEIEKYIKKE